MKADTMENALKCIKFLHEKNCKMIVVTSLEFCDESEQLYVIASCKFFIIIINEFYINCSNMDKLKFIYL